MYGTLITYAVLGDQLVMQENILCFKQLPWIYMVVKEEAVSDICPKYQVFKTRGSTMKSFTTYIKLLRDSQIYLLSIPYYFLRFNKFLTISPISTFAFQEHQVPLIVLHCGKNNLRILTIRFLWTCFCFLTHDTLVSEKSY